MIAQPKSLDEEIQRVLGSRALRRSEQLRKLLSYLQERARDTEPTLLSEAEIGARALGRKNFNPKLDTIVRSEMLRLRRKLDEYYVDEDPAATHRVSFDRNSYCPVLVPNEPNEPELPVAPLLEIQPHRSFRSGVAAGAGVTVIAAALLFAWTSWHRGANPTSILAAHPLWQGFQSAQVDVLVGTPLFFVNDRGYERLFDQNLPSDLPQARKKLAVWPALPRWDIWTSYDNVGAAVALSQALGEVHSTATFIPAREESSGSLTGRKTIVIGAPRYAPLLMDVLADENFTVPPQVPGSGYGGFKNVSPKAGELPVYFTEEATVEQRSDESTPDYALISSKHLPGGGELLSVFGNRAQTAGFMVRALLGDPLLEQLRTRVFGPAASGAGKYKTAQVVVRVDYSKGRPTGAVYVTHRIRY